MILNIRGTHGSGKSTIVRRVLDRYNAVPITVAGQPKHLGYVMESYAGPLYVVGSYKAQCGGCDSIQPYAGIWPRVVEYAKLGHVLFEGALVSNSYGTIGRASEVYGDQFVFCFLDTPLDLCIARIEARRLARGNTKPFDPAKSLVRIYNKNLEIRSLAIRLNRRVVALDYRKAVQQVLGTLKNAQTR